ncbi:MAG: hypothetical protein VX470_10220, partial [Planctomycetota bacterium]|nr:hypothetical protein [Planctomycetota bacterium]
LFHEPLRFSKHPHVPRDGRILLRHADQIGQGYSWVVPRSWGTKDLEEIKGKKSCVIQAFAKVKV